MLLSGVSDVLHLFCCLNSEAWNCKASVVVDTVSEMEKHGLGTGTTMLSAVAGCSPFKDMNEFTCSALCCLLFQ